MLKLMDDKEVARWYLGDKFTEDIHTYLDRLYNRWALKPRFLNLWFEEDLEKIRTGQFKDPGYSQLRDLRNTFVSLCAKVEEMYTELELTESEVEILYDAIYSVYMNRKLHFNKRLLDLKELDDTFSSLMQDEFPPF